MMNFKMIYIISSFLLLSTNVEAKYILDVKLAFTPCANNEVILELKGIYPQGYTTILGWSIQKVGTHFNVIIHFLSVGGIAAPSAFEFRISLGTLPPGEYSATILQDNPLSVSWITNKPEENVSVKIYASHLCKWGDGSATAIACGGSNWTFLWSTGETSHRINNLEPGNYSVTVTADNGSKDSVTVSIGRKYQTNITVGIDDCNSDNPLWKVSALGVLDSSSINVYLKYSWSNGFESLFSGDATLENGKYWLTVSNFVGECLTFDSIDLKPLELIVNYEGDIVHAVATGGIAPYTYQWSSGDTTSNIQIQSGDLFTVTVTDALGCVREYNNRPKAPFVTTWDTSLPGTSASNQIIIPGYGTNYSIHWEEVDHPENRDSIIGNNTTTLTFPDPGKYRVSITPGDGTFYRIGFSNTGDTSKIISIDQWGEIEWRSFAGAFKGCINLTSDAPDLPDLSKVTDMSEMFYNCILLNGPSNIGDWDVSNVTTMRSMFRSSLTKENNQIFVRYYTSSFNQDLSTWNVSNVTDMSRMFSGASNFNQNIGLWDVSKSKNMEGMFYSAYLFDQYIGDWDVSSVTKMKDMFRCESFDHVSNIGIGGSFNQYLGNWNVSKVTNMSGMFKIAQAYNQDMGNWNVSNVINMSKMFSSANKFNKDIGRWDVSKVTDMNGAFLDASSFNHDIGSWDVSKVTNMDWMFSIAYDFNQYIGDWDVANVLSMSNMFGRSHAFDQYIGNWDVSKVTNMSNMFSNSKVFNQDISNWNVANVTNMSDMFSYTLAFNQDIGNWNVSNVKEMRSMFDKSGMKCDNYSSTLIGWNKNSDLTSGINLGAAGMKYGTEAVSARENLKTAHGWIFTGDSPAGVECSMTVSTENTESGFQIKLNPNPFTHQINVEYSGNEKKTIILYNQFSQQVLQQTLYNSTTIVTEHLPAGLYIYELKNDQGTIRSGKIVKM